MPNGDGGCSFCGKPGTPLGIEHEADCPYSTGVFPKGYIKEIKMTDEELEKRFTYHQPTPGRLDSYRSIRAIAADFAMTVSTLVPESREQALALTKIEEAMFWANAGIARNEEE
jgi:hypothetical protein